MSSLALCKYAPMSEQRPVLFPSNFGTLVLLSQGQGVGGYELGTGSVCGRGIPRALSCLEGDGGRARDAAA